MSSLTHVFNYARTNTAATNKLLLAISPHSFSIVSSGIYQNIVEVVDYLNYPGVVNSVLKGSLTDPLYSIYGIKGTEYCLMLYRTSFVALVNPSAQSHLSTIHYQSTLDASYSPDKDFYYFFNSVPIFGIKNGVGNTFVYTPVFFYSQTEGKSYGMARISICGSVGCAHCNGQLTDCQECQEGVQLFPDPVYNDQVCISMCPNPSVEVLSIINKRCINCLSEYSLDRNACWMVKDFDVVEISPTKGDTGMDEFSSHTFKLTFTNSSNIIKNIVHIIGENKVIVGDKLKVSDY